MDAGDDESVLLWKYLGYEINEKILLLLPVKDILNCKLVCKSWYRRLSNGDFITFYNRYARNHRLLIKRCEIIDQWRIPRTFSVVTIDKVAGPSDLNLGFIGENVVVVASCNGLLLCHLTHFENCMIQVYFVCNPITREFTRLANRDFRLFLELQIDFVGLACELSSPGYRVALASIAYERPKLKLSFLCFIYNSGTNNWRRFYTPIEKHEIDIYHLLIQQVVYVNGRLHWLVCNLSCILVLDLENDSWVRFPLPLEIPPDSEEDQAYLLDYDDFLSIFHISNIQCDIWVLKDYIARTWEPVATVNLLNIPLDISIIPFITPISHTDGYTYWINGRRGFPFAGVQIIYPGCGGQIIGYDHKARVWNARYEGNDSPHLQWAFTFQTGYSALRKLCVLRN